MKFWWLISAIIFLAAIGASAHATDGGRNLERLFKSNDGKSNPFSEGVKTIESRIFEANHTPYWRNRRPQSLDGHPLTGRVSITSFEIRLRVFVYPREMPAERRGVACEDAMDFVEDVLGFRGKAGDPNSLAEKLGEYFRGAYSSSSKSIEEIGQELSELFVVQAHVVANTGVTSCWKSVSGGMLVDQRE